MNFAKNVWPIFGSKLFRVAEPAGAETFGWSRSRYTEVSAPAPAPGQTKVVYLIIIHIE